MEDIESDSAEGFGLIGLILGISAIAIPTVELLWPSYTEEELANFVDTWEPAVIFGMLLLVVFALGLLLAVLFAAISKSLTRRLFNFSAIAFVLAIALQIVSLNVLTARTEKASRHELHWVPLPLR